MANDILIKVGADVSDFSRKMAESNRALQDFGKRNQEAFDSFKKVGTAAVGIGTAIGVGLGKSVKTAANFEQAMSNVKAISGATGKEFDSLRDKAIEMGAETAFSASESADAMANLAQMGWETDDILAGIEHTLNLAAAGGLELADSAMIMANTMNQFGLEATEAERVSDVLAKTASSAGTDVYEMADAMQYAGANAAAAGMDIEQTAAFVGVLGDAGITGSKAGTALNSMLRDLKKNAEDGAVAVGEQSVALYDAEGNMRPMPDVISEIIRATDGMNDAQRDAALSTIFGDQALVAFNAIAGQGADSVSELSEELYDSEGAAADMADTMMDNLNGALTELGSAFEGVQIAIGSALIPAIEWVTDKLKSLADWFNGLSDDTKENIAKFAALSSVLMIVGGSLLIIIGFIPNIVNGFMHVIRVIKLVGKAITLLTSPVGLVILAIAGLAFLIYKYWDEIKEFTIKTWNAIKEFFSELWESIKEIFIAVWEPIKEAWSTTVEWLQELWTGIGEFFSELWEGVTEVFTAFVDGMKEIFSPITEFFSEILGVVSEVFTENWNVLTEFLSETWENITTIASAAWELIKNVILGPILLMINLMTGDMDELNANLQAIWGNIKDAAGRIWGALKDQVSKLMESLGEILSNIWDGMKRVASIAWEGMKSAASTIWNGIKSLGSTIWNGIKETVTNLANKAKEGAIKAWNTLKEKTSEAFNKVVDFIKDPLENIDLFSIGKDIIQGLINGIGSMATAVWDKAKDIGRGIADGVKGMLGIKSPSRVMMSLGKWTSLGLAEGIEDYAKYVDRASDRLAESAVPDVSSVDMSYNTPSGVRNTLSSAVQGTVDVNAGKRDEALVGAINALRRDLTQLRVDMDGETVGRIVRPHVNEGNAIDDNLRYF